MVGPESQVAGIGHVGSTFEVKTADGRKTSFSETRLRFKIDSSAFGPSTGQPVNLPGGMIGDRVNGVLRISGRNRHVVGTARLTRVGSDPIA
jgi:hypothetical protein